MEFTKTKPPGLVVIQPDVFRDEQGFFLEAYCADNYALGGIRRHFVQDDHSRSSKGTIRGLHAQRKHAQDKLVRVLAAGSLMLWRTFSGGRRPICNRFQSTVFG
jgi:dTDP-4-dehydrorhamnose 3,5-epimerase